MTEHAHLALTAPQARKYPADVAPFSALSENSIQAMRQLLSLLAFDEVTYLIGDRPPTVSGLALGKCFPCLQMVLGKTFSEKQITSSPVALKSYDAPAMVELTDIAFPGFFRARTHEMGSYYGVFSEGRLIAMAGERMAVPGGREISGVCTHPDYTGKGLAGQLICFLVQQHVKAGFDSFLHVRSDNSRAISLYQHLGFEIRNEVWLHPVSLVTHSAEPSPD